MKQTKICETCFQTFEAKNKKGIEQRFCKDQCRNEFHSVGRKYFSMQIETGKLDYLTAKNVLQKHYSKVKSVK
mgnify:FL=1|jgi:hypothetical protein